MDAWGLSVKKTGLTEVPVDRQTSSNSAFTFDLLLACGTITVLKNNLMYTTG
jgi:hypothetical protein